MRPICIDRSNTSATYSSGSEQRVEATNSCITILPARRQNSQHCYRTYDTPPTSEARPGEQGWYERGVSVGPIVLVTDVVLSCYSVPENIPPPWGCKAFYVSCAEDAPKQMSYVRLRARYRDHSAAGPNPVVEMGVWFSIRRIDYAVNLFGASWCCSCRVYIRVYMMIFPPSSFQEFLRFSHSRHPRDLKASITDPERDPLV